MEIDHLSFAYRGTVWFSEDITLDIPSRSFVALVGHTGSGKSTLASLMMGYYPLTHGEIRIDGRPLASLSHSALRRGIAMVQQDPVVLADTFYANVALGRDISEAQVWEALEAVQLAAVARSMSDGLYTQLGEQGNNLSVGQKQLLALARVLVDTPQVLILDEATANIDSGTEQAIQQALAKVRQHTTLVVIAHRLSTIVEADTILGSASRSGCRAGHPSAAAGGERPLLADVSAAAGRRRAGGQRQRGVAQRLMHHQQAGNAGRPAMVQNVTSNAPLWCIFCAPAPLRRILPDLSPVFLPSKGRFAAFFSFLA